MVEVAGVARVRVQERLQLTDTAFCVDGALPLHGAFALEEAGEKTSLYLPTVLFFQTGQVCRPSSGNPSGGVGLKVGFGVSALISHLVKLPVICSRAFGLLMWSSIP